MPIAAKFSEGFYEKFGHPATDELVDYLNSVDTTYRTELERLNDANWARFEARLDRRASALEAKFDVLETKFSALEAKMETKFGALEATFDAKLDQRLAELRAELIKWMFLFWLGTVGTVIALQRLA
jgi:hypothetical protein